MPDEQQEFVYSYTRIVHQDRVTSRPAERINQTLHATLHALMLQVASDIKPLLIGECTITDIA